MFQRRLLLMAACLLLVAALGSSQANAQYDTWSGTCSFTVKITAVDDNPPGSQKLVTQSEAKSGTMEMYIGPNGPTPDPEGYYLRFIKSGVTVIGITEMVAIRADLTKSKSDKFLVLGVGSFYDPGPPIINGLVYLDASGTIKKDATGQPTSISLTMKFAGGAGDFVWNCAPKVTLTKSPI